ncbi:unnamed protein product, partial [marine sediment metagenome]
NFLEDPVGYSRDISFDLLNELIFSLAEGLVAYIEDKWGDET